MQSVSVQVPNLGSATALVDARAIDPKSSILVLSAGLGYFDTFGLYVTLDPTGSLQLGDPNMVQLGIVRGSPGNGQGSVTNPVNLQGYPFFALQRLSGTVTGAGLVCYASGPTNPSGAVPVVRTGLPAIGATALLPIGARYDNSVLIGLDSKQEIDDTFDVYGANDPTATITNGSSFIGSIQGGGGLTGTAVAVTDYLYALVNRTGGSTLPGFACAYGPGGSGGKGVANVLDQPAGGIITPLAPETPQQLVDQSFVIEVFQTTGGPQALTLPNPSIIGVSSQRTVINGGSAAFTMYGATVAPLTAVNVVWVPGLIGQWVAVG